jgi:hypothetical protein
VPRHRQQANTNGDISSQGAIAAGNVRVEYAAPILSNEQHVATPEPTHHQHWYAEADWWVAGFTGALFLATVGLWIFTALLWRATKRAVQDSARGIKIASRTLKHSKKASERELRAYVTVKLMGISIPREGRAMAQVDIFNQGKTPAHDVIVLWSVCASGELTPEEIDSADTLASNPEESVMVIGPGDFRGANVIVKGFTPSEIAAIHGKKQYAWVIGRVEYKDAFGHRRRTRFCHRYQGQNTGADEGTYAPYGNSYT